MKRAFTLAIAVLLCALSAGLVFCQSGHDLFQQALVKERADGNLAEAIKLYQRIVREFGKDRALSAKALVQMGQCYEKLGETQAQEARKAYERVVREYADQRDAATEARARLATLRAAPLAKEKAGPILTELKLPASMEQHALSPDGTKVAYTSAWHGTPRTAHLMVRDLVSGTDRQVTNLKRGIPSALVWSPDGKSIAYCTRAGGEGNYASEMRIVSLENGPDRAMGIRGDPQDWSRDGRYILYGHVEGPRVTLNLLPVGGGQPKTLLSEDRNALVERSVRNFRFSPDGKFVSFARRNKQAFDIFLLPIEGGEPISITDDPAEDREPIWAPDGKTLLFLSNRSLGREDLWALSIADGKPSGEPFVVKSDVGRARLFSLSNNGRLLFARRSGVGHIYSVALDAKTQQPAAPAVRLTKDSPVAGNGWPAWSPDGKRIAYISSPGPARERELVLRVMSADGSNDREIVSFHESDNDPLAWSPDNDHVYFSGRQPGTGVGIYSISTSTRELKPVLLGDQPVAHLSCSPDGSQLAFVRWVNRHQIFLADADGKNVRQITFDDSMSAFYPTWSPNGKQIAFYRYVRSGGARMGLMILTLEGGALTEVVGGARGSSELYNFWEPSWSPDGNNIVFAAPGPTSKPWLLPGGGRAPVLWLTKLPNGKPEPFRVNLGPSETISYFSPSWSPDGTKMLFSAETNAYQLLLMENFLPAPKAAKQ